MIDLGAQPSGSASRDPTPRFRWLGDASKQRSWRFAVLAVAMLVLYLRKPDALASPQFWAEDGTIFFKDAFDFGLRSLAMPYNGYFHLVARLFAFLLSPVPTALAPAAYAWAAAAFTLAVCALALSDRTPLSRAQRTILALAVVAAPVRPEIYLTFCNAQWMLALALVLVAIWRPPGTLAGCLADCALVLAIGLSGVYSLLFAPLYLWRLFRERTRHAAVLLGLVLACAGIQTLHLSATRIPGEARWSNPDFLRAPANWFLFMFGGPFHEAQLEWPLTVLAAACLILLYLSLCRTALRRRDAQLGALVIASLLPLLSAIWAHRASPLAVTISGRYVYLPTVLLLWSLAALLPSRAAAAALVAAFVSFVFLLPERTPMTDYRWREASRCIDVGAPCVIPINPPGWAISIQSKRPPRSQ